MCRCARGLSICKGVVRRELLQGVSPGRAEDFPGAAAIRAPGPESRCDFGVRDVAGVASGEGSREGGGGTRIVAEAE